MACYSAFQRGYPGGNAGVALIAQMPSACAVYTTIRKDEYMKKIICAVAVAASFAAPQAFAQAKNFEGFSVLGAVNVNNNKAGVTVTTPASTTSETKTASNVGIQAEYGWALGDSFVLGVGATAGLSDYDISNGVKLKNSYSFYVAPGVAVSKDTLLYAKLASASAKMETSAVSIDLSGLGYGVGARFFSGKNVFFQVEYTYNKYDDKNYANGKVTNETGVLALGVGYKF